MACDITTGRNKGCKDNLGGISTLYLFNYLEDPFTIAAGEATAMNVALTTAYEFELAGDNNNLKQEMISERQNGTTVNTQTITAAMHKMDAATSANLNLLAKGYPQAVVKTRNGSYHLVGQTDGIDFTVAAASGGSYTDMNGYTLTGVSSESSLSPILDSATVTAFLAVVAANL